MIPAQAVEAAAKALARAAVERESKLSHLDGMNGAPNDNQYRPTK